MRRRTLYIIIGIVAVIIVLFLLVLGGKKPFLTTTGTLEVKVNDTKATIDIIRTIPNPQIVDTKGATGTFSSPLPVGTYIVTAKDGQSSSQQSTTLKGGDTKKVILNLSSIGDTEPVTSRGASSLIVDDAMAFIDRGHNGLYRVDSGNNELQIKSDLPFITARWANSSYGVAQDANGRLYRVTDTITPITAPSQYGDSTTYALAPNHDTYISDGKTLYIGKPEGDFKKLYDSSKSLTIITASNNAVLLSEIPSGSREGDLLAIDRTGQVKRIDGEAYSAKWSPSGGLIALSNDSRAAVLDANLQTVATLPKSNVNSPTWLDDHTVLYGVNDELWKYDLPSGQATLITKFDSSGQVSEITPSKDGAYLYITVQKTTQSGDLSFELVRLGLHNQPITPMLQRLRLIIPNNVNGCELGYINFARPAVTVHPTSASQDACMLSAKNYLQGYGVDPASIQLVPSP